ncbi:glycine zipper 2TM domain-containing protein, partial [Thermaurantiacus sp.]
ERWHNRRGRDWREHCRLRDRGNGGLVTGAALGGVLGSRIVRDDPTAGAIVGAAAGGLIGRSIDRNDGRC